MLTEFLVCVVMIHTACIMNVTFVPGWSDDVDRRGGRVQSGTQDVD